MPLDVIWLSIFAEVFVNLAAGWIGAAIVVPLASQYAVSRKVQAVILNMIGAGFALILAHQFRTIAGI